ncbi:uracil-DNA glycosylase [Marinilabilia rubra]|uniref:Uracil-DNA glycosylase n=1 Tax=Marinilabilia rubra TaxID=2162893 RepID=A0A2U2B503_9BACT|nr:uracil-DNA glycosylase [Marinilabilia rubra]PWD98117.1 uracil-DNA glycosylase [Marinilabilia rubra]
MQIIPKDISPSWQNFFNENTYKLLSDIENRLSMEEAESLTPLPERMLRFFQLDLHAAKVIIIGQDPYPQQGVATGRAFEVGPLKSWTETFRNTSLRNIVRALYVAQNGNFKTFNEIKKELLDGKFKLLPPHQLFKHWEKQGVLLLNTSFSCRIGNPGSHSKIWKPFTDSLLSYVNNANPSLNWFLWGNKAKEAVDHINLKNSIETTHPMICHKRPNDFLFGEKNVFAETSGLIDWLG